MTGRRSCEEGFDRQTGYKRAQQESFDYCHAVKNGGVEAIREQARARVEQELQRRQEKVRFEKAQQQQVQEREQQSRGRRIGR